MPTYDTVNAVRKATAAEPQTILIPKGWRPPPSELRLCVFALISIQRKDAKTQGLAEAETRLRPGQAGVPTGTVEAQS